MRRRHSRSAPLLLRRSVGRRWISVVNLWATGMLSIGLPYVQAARDGGVKSTGCPYGVRLYNIQTFPLCVASCCKPIQAIAARLKRCEIKYCYAFVALGRPGSRRGRLLQHQGWVKAHGSEPTSSIRHNGQYQPILQVVIKACSAKLIALV